MLPGGFAILDRHPGCIFEKLLTRTSAGLVVPLSPIGFRFLLAGAAILPAPAWWRFSGANGGGAGRLSGNPLRHESQLQTVTGHYARGRRSPTT